MKLALGFILLASTAQAAPYFRLLDLAKPQVSAGALVDPENSGNSSAASMLAVVSHSTRDGCLLPSVVCEDWTLLAVGVSANSGKTLLALGPSINVAPLAKALLLRGLNAVSAPETLPGVKESLGSVPLDRSDISVAFGPTWVLSPTENWKGAIRIFAGGSWRF